MYLSIAKKGRDHDQLDTMSNIEDRVHNLEIIVGNALLVVIDHDHVVITGVTDDPTRLIEGRDDQELGHLTVLQGVLHLLEDITDRIIRGQDLKSPIKLNHEVQSLRNVSVPNIL